MSNQKMSNFHFDPSLKLSQGEVHDFSGEVQKLSGEVQNDLRGGAHLSKFGHVMVFYCSVDPPTLNVSFLYFIDILCSWWLVTFYNNVRPGNSCKISRFLRKDLIGQSCEIAKHMCHPLRYSICVVRYECRNTAIRVWTKIFIYVLLSIFRTDSFYWS
jgi:hypothetical protein